MNDTIEIRAEQPADYDAIGDVISRAFGRAGEGTLVRELRKLPGFDPALSLVAVDAGVVIGHILFTDVTIRRPNGARRSALAPAAAGCHS